MISSVNISSNNSERFFVVGSLQGNYRALISLLYKQEFSYKDSLVFCGDFINKENPQTIDLLYFMKNNTNVYAVQGKNELDINEESKARDVVDFYQFDSELLEYIENLPLCIEIFDYYIVSKGLEPYKSLSQQHSKVTYFINKYDRESRYYQFNNSKKKNWYEFKRKDKDVIFSNPEIEDVEVTAGYNLINDGINVYCAVLTAKHDPVLLIQSLGV